MCGARPAVCGASCSLRTGCGLWFPHTDPAQQLCSWPVSGHFIRSTVTASCRPRQETLCMLHILVEVISRTLGNFFAASQIVAVCNTDGSHLCKPVNRQRSASARGAPSVRYSKLFQAVVTNRRRGRCISFRNFPQAGDDALRCSVNIETPLQPDSFHKSRLWLHASELVYKHRPEGGRAFLCKLLNFSSKPFPVAISWALFTVEIDSLLAPLILSGLVNASSCQHSTWARFNTRLLFHT